MLLQLHRNFTFINGGKIRAYVNEEGILKADSRCINWEDTMYALTYFIKDKKKCPYCGNAIRKKNLTIDHMFPRAYGGVTISNNLIPCCEYCNSTKSNLNVAEFMELKRLNTKEEKKEYRKKVIHEKERFKYIKGFSLPDEWISYWKPENVKIRTYYNNYYVKSKKLNYNMDYIKKYNHFQRPIIIDRNGWLIDGYTWFKAAKQSGAFKKIPVIKLDNVELINIR